MQTLARSLPTAAEFGDSRLPERFWSKVSVDPSGCWLWTALTDTGGYGVIRWGTPRKAHRVLFEELYGVDPDLDLDHLCRVRHCVNPAHLEPVTRAENVRRGLSVALRPPKTQCLRGHSEAEFGSYKWAKGKPGNGSCNECRRIASRDWKRRKREDARADAAEG